MDRLVDWLGDESVLLAFHLGPLASCLSPVFKGGIMGTTTILHEYERRLSARLARGEIATATSEAYLNDASRIFEVLLLLVPEPAIEGYMQAAGYRGDYSGVIETLADLAREPHHTSFPIHPQRTLHARISKEDQSSLPGV
jgi:hypothetical protein